MKNIVIYESKYGSTKKYALWIAETLKCDLYEKKQMNAKNLKDYDTIIYGGGLYAGGVSGINFLIKNAPVLSDKNIILFTCGIADPKDEANVSHIMEGIDKTMPDELKDKTKVFHLRGGLDYSKLSVVHRAMMAMLYKVLKSKDYDQLREEDKQMIDTYGQKIDFSDRETIMPIIEYVNKL